MYRPECGTIDFIWGVPGDKSDEYRGGHGISHAFAKHPGDIQKLPEILAKGTAYKVRSKGEDGNYDYFGRIAFLYGKGAVFVDPAPKGKSLIVTAYQTGDEGGLRQLKENPKA